MTGADLVWVDGTLLPAGAPVADARDSAFATGLGCYTTARWSGGRAHLAAAHAARLARDAATLGIGAVDPAAVLDAFAALGRAAFGADEGVLRIQASRDGSGHVRLVGVPRPVGDEPMRWRAVRAPWHHGGPRPFGGAKLSGDPLLARAREHARRSGADECLLFDAAGRLVEGARTNAILEVRDGALRTPPLERGGVAGVARAHLLRALPEIAEADVDAEALRSAREVVLVNAVRGAVALVALDGAPLPADGVLRARLAEALADAS